MHCKCNGNPQNPEYGWLEVGKGESSGLSMVQWSGGGERFSCPAEKGADQLDGLASEKRESLGSNSLVNEAIFWDFIRSFSHRFMNQPSQVLQPVFGHLCNDPGLTLENFEDMKLIISQINLPKNCVTSPVQKVFLPHIQLTYALYSQPISPGFNLWDPYQVTPSSTW